MIARDDLVDAALEAEAADIERGALAASGSARAHVEVLAAEQRERGILDEEVRRLSAELAASTSEFEEEITFPRAPAGAPRPLLLE